MNKIESAEITEAVEKGFLKILCDGMFHCTCCSCPISGEMQAMAHIRGTKHAKKVRQSQSIQGEVSPTTVANTKKLCQGININKLETEDSEMIPVQTTQTTGFFCEICQIGLNGKFQYDLHLAGKNHAKKLKGLQSASLLERNGDSSSSRSSSCSPTLHIKGNLSRKLDSPISTNISTKSNLVNASQCNEISSSVIPLTEFNNKLNLHDTDFLKDNLIIVGVKDPIPEFFQS